MRHLIPLILAATGIAHAAEPCRPIDGIDELLTPGRVVLLGEIHGTRESPAFALDVACHAAHSDLPVIVGLELSGGEQGRVDTFMDSEGTDDDRRALLAGHLWQRDYQDGRASVAMLDLIDGLRGLREQGHDVRITMFDEPRAGGQQRDRAMGRNLAAVVKGAPDAMLVALAGNRHSRVSKGDPRNSEYEPMGYVLGRETSFDNLVALNAAHGGGNAWICAPECGISDLVGHHGDAEWTIEIDDATRPAGYAGWYHVGAIRASPPARTPDAEVPVPAAQSPVARMSPEPEGVPRASDPSLPLSKSETSVQGDWQAYDFSSKYKTWAMSIDGRRFRAAGGDDDWYEGRISLSSDEDPAWIDFEIEDCRCSYKGMTSKAIYEWDGSSLVVSAPTPGKPRPAGFVENSGQMMRWLRKEDE